MTVRCLFCGPLDIEETVEAVHEHATSESHQTMVLLAAELERFIHPSTQ